MPQTLMGGFTVKKTKLRWGEFSSAREDSFKPHRSNPLTLEKYTVWLAWQKHTHKKVVELFLLRKYQTKMFNIWILYPKILTLCLKKERERRIKVTIYPPSKWWVCECLHRYRITVLHHSNIWTRLSKFINTHTARSLNPVQSHENPISPFFYI